MSETRKFRATNSARNHCFVYDFQTVSRLCAAAMDMPTSPYDPAAQASGVSVQRDKPRDSIFLGATMWFDGSNERTNVRVRNISAGGMMVDYPGQCQKGRVLFAEIKGIGKISGSVAWTTGTRMGIKFDAEVNPELARVKTEAAPPIPEYAKPLLVDRRPGLSLR